MITRTNIKSKVEPEMVEINGEIVYKRLNLKKCIEVDPVFNTEDTFYIYDEEQYPLPEWNSIVISKLEDTIEVLKYEIEQLKAHIK